MTQEQRNKRGQALRDLATACGVTERTASRWNKLKLVVWRGDAVDSAATATKVDAFRDPRGGRPDRGIGPPKPTVVTTPEGDDPDPLTPPPEGAESLVEARTRKERALAEKAELEVARLRGDLIPRADAEAAYVGVIVAAKAAIVAVPVRVAPLIAGVTDVRAIRDIVRREIETALKGLSDDPPAV